MGLIVIIIGYSYQHTDAVPLISIIPIGIMLYITHNSVNKDLKELEEE